MNDSALLLRQDDDGVTTLTLNRPQARNSLSHGLLREVMVKNLAAQDAREGISAFLDKRQPVWCGK